MARRNQFFRNMDRLEQMVSTPRYDKSKRRSLTEDDYDDFERAGNIRHRRKPSVQTIEAARTVLKKQNLIRYIRLKSDVHWAQRELRKMGRNPDDLWVIFGE